MEFVRQPRLPLPLGEVPEGRRGFSQRSDTLSVSFADSSPKGGAKTSPNNNFTLEDTNSTTIFILQEEKLWLTTI